MKIINKRLSLIHISEPTSPDEQAEKMANLTKYGTYNTKHIWMLRYGMSFEDIELLEDYIESIDERGIIVMQEFSNLPQKVKGCIDRFVE